MKHEVDKLSTKLNTLEEHDPAVSLAEVVPTLKTLRETVAEKKRELSKLEQTVIKALVKLLLRPRLGLGQSIFYSDEI